MQLINIETGVIFEGEIERVKEEELKKLKENKDFTFDWSIEKENEVYKIKQVEKKTILGLISLKDYPNEFRIHINLIESNKNQRGKSKQIENIPGCLIAFACRKSFKKGYDGFVSLLPKTQLIPYYKKYGFIEIGTQMAIWGTASRTLITKYFKDEEI